MANYTRGSNGIEGDGEVEGNQYERKSLHDMSSKYDHLGLNQDDSSS